MHYPESVDEQINKTNFVPILQDLYLGADREVCVKSTLKNYSVKIVLSTTKEMYVLF